LHVASSGRWPRASRALSRRHRKQPARGPPTTLPTPFTGRGNPGYDSVRARRPPPLRANRSGLVGAALGYRNAKGNRMLAIRLECRESSAQIRGIGAPSGERRSAEAS
jgi:hypothetical protein